MRRTLTPATKRPRLRSQYIATSLSLRESRMPKHLLSLVGGMLAIGLLGAAYLARPAAQGAQAQGTANGQWRYARRRCREHALLPARPGHAGQLRDAQGSVAVQPARRRRSDDRASDAELCRRQAAERRRAAASRRVDRPDERQAALELRRARDLPFEVLDARGLRQGRRVPRNQRSRRRLHRLAGLLPLRVRRGNREARSRTGDGRSPFPRSPRPASSISSRT